MEQQASLLGFKKLTKDNWRLPDPINEYFIKLNLSTGEKLKVSDDERAKEFLEIQLADSVPTEVHRQFETARGAMLYGHYFYPLFTLGVDQLFRVAESAITHKCLHHGLAKEKATYKIKLEKLKKSKLVTEQQFDDWSYYREMRNEFSHSKTQIFFPPYEAISFLKNIVNSINKLYEKA